MIVEVQFVDGTSEAFEIEYSCCPWEYQKEEQCFSIWSIEGHVMIQAAFVKYLRCYKVGGK